MRHLANHGKREMIVSRDLRRLRPFLMVYFGAAAAVLVLIAGLVSLWPRSAVALPTYAQQTGLACGRCHVSPGGGGQRTAFGNAFLANGHKLPSTADKKDAGGKKTGADKAVPSSSAPAAAPVEGSFITDSDFARAQAWSLRQPYYSHFRY